MLTNTQRQMQQQGAAWHAGVRQQGRAPQCDTAPPPAASPAARTRACRQAHAAQNAGRILVERLLRRADGAQAARRAVCHAADRVEDKAAAGGRQEGQQGSAQQQVSVEQQIGGCAARGSPFGVLNNKIQRSGPNNNAARAKPWQQHTQPTLAHLKGSYSRPFTVKSRAAALAARAAAHVAASAPRCFCRGQGAQRPALQVQSRAAHVAFSATHPTQVLAARRHPCCPAPTLLPRSDPSAPSPTLLFCRPIMCDEASAGIIRPSA